MSSASEMTTLSKKSIESKSNASNHPSNRSVTEDDLSCHSNISSYAYGSEVERDRSRSGTPHVSNLESKRMMKNEMLIIRYDHGCANSFSRKDEKV